MGRRRASQSIVANPVLVGAVTTLVIVVAVFLAYNANNGLPFVPTREVKVHLSSGSNLVKGNEVREGGYRIGVITALEPVPFPDGATGAEAVLKLDKRVGEIPADTSLTVRSRSALGLKYLQFERGSSDRKLRDGDTIPATQTKVPVQFEEIFEIFDKPTRSAAQANLSGFGNAFTGRGQDLNTTIAELPRLFAFLAPVMRNLSDPRTGLSRFFSELGDAARVVAPIADTQARLFTVAADTFEAISRDPSALQDTIAKAPGTLSAGEESFRAQRPFLEETAAFSRDLRFAAADLRISLPTINDALEVGTPVVRRSAQLNDELRKTMIALRDLVQAPSTNLAIRGLIGTVTTLNPQLRYLGPYVTVCNYWNYFWTFVAEHFSERDAVGQSQRALANTTGSAPNGTGSMGAFKPANGEPNREPGAAPQNKHGQDYGAAINEDGTADCEAAQRGYPGKLNQFGAENIAIDSYTPGSQGPVFDSFNDLDKPFSQRALGPARVQPGQTFSRYMQTGPMLSQDPPRRSR
jgi:virulence factor Mce-like protein